ncbi:MAG: hypothetical protein WCS17_09520 [Prevotella sp.]
MKNHYNQNARLKYFARKEGDKYKITMVDVLNKKVGWRKTDSAYYEKGLYSDDLEYQLKIHVEDPGMKIFSKIERCRGQVKLKRSELDIVQKYILIQNYRSPGNMDTYAPGHERDIFGLNQAMLSEGENYREHLFKIMKEILETPWIDLLNSNDHEIKKNVFKTRGTSTLFIRTNDEFVLNDRGSVTERRYFDITKCLGKSKTIELLKEQIKQLGVNPTDEEVCKYFDQHKYLDTFQFIPITSNCGIILVDRLYTMHFKNQFPINEIFKQDLDSLFLEKYYKQCTTDYVNREIVYEPLKNGYTQENVDKTNERIAKYQDPNDTYTYPVQTLDFISTAYLNALMMNEVEHYMGFKTPKKVMPFIQFYNEQRAYHDNDKNDLTWIDEKTNWEIPLN